MPKIIIPVPREETPVLFTFAPLAMLRLAKMLKKAGYEPVILDAKQLKGDFLPRLEKEYRDNPAFVWCCGKLGRQLIDLMAAAKLAKKTHPELPVVFGGWYYPLDKKASLAPDYVDYVVSGQAEYTLVELADALTKGGDIQQIPGLRGKNEDGSIWEAPPRAWERNLDVFGPYPFDMIDMEFYVSSDNGRCQPMVAGTKRSINYTYSRGCHGMCSFCHTTAIWDRAWFSHTPEHVTKELNHLITEYKVEGIDFHDTNMFTGLGRARKILQGFKDGGHDIRWKCSVRVDQVNALTTEMMELIRDTGCAEFAIGAESSSSRVLGLVAKEVVATEIVDCSKRCEKYGILPAYSFMVGFPDEHNWEDSKATLSFMAMLRHIVPNALAEYFYYTPIPGTPLFKGYASSYLPKHDTLEDYLIFSAYDPNMPWVDDKLPALLKMATRFYFLFALPTDDMKQRMRGKGPVGIALRVLRRLSDWRVRNRRYGFPFEYRLARFIKDVLIKKLGLFKKFGELL
jgi:radical SAM superfamily enzyme YgiQ (UPF0313 family)